MVKCTEPKLWKPFNRSYVFKNIQNMYLSRYIITISKKYFDFVCPAGKNIKFALHSSTGAIILTTREFSKTWEVWMTTPKQFLVSQLNQSHI